MPIGQFKEKINAEKADKEQQNKEGENKKAKEEKIKKAMKKVNQFLEHEFKHLAVFSGDSSLRFVPSQDAKTFHFYPKTREIIIPVKWFVENDYSPDEICWAVYLELGHLIDARENPKAFLDRFAYMKKEVAPKIASWIEEELFKTGAPKQIIEGLKKSGRLKKIGYKIINHFYGALDDIYVNSLVSQKVPLYSTEEGRKGIEKIYQEKLNKDNDFRGQPKYLQFINFLIREEMLLDKDKAILSPEVEEIIKKKKFLGRDIKEIINEGLKPKAGKLIDPGKRYALIKELIEPVYLNLVKEDLAKIDFQDLLDKNSNSDKNKKEKNGNKKDKNKNKKGEENFSFSDFEKHFQKKASPDFLEEKEIEKILKEIKKENDYFKMSPKEREEERKKRLEEIFDNKYGIDERTRAIFNEASEAIAPYRKKMRQFWKELIVQKIAWRQKKYFKQTKGSFNVDDFIEEFPRIQENIQEGKINTKPKIYEKNRAEIVLENYTERIEVSLVVDMSNSIFEAAGQKIKALREVVALLALSLKDFNDYLDKIRKKTRIKLTVDLEVYVFGTDFYKAKQFDKDLLKKKNFNREAEIIKVFKYLQNSLGGTNDAAVFKDILTTEINSKIEEKIKKEKLKKIVLEITDGIPFLDFPEMGSINFIDFFINSEKAEKKKKEIINKSAKITKKEINNLLEKGVLTAGFKVGDDEEEKVIFNEIWNKNGKKLGIYIGNELEKLPLELLKVLKSELENIKI